jgi:hypothetical protein
VLPPAPPQGPFNPVGGDAAPLIHGEGAAPVFPTPSGKVLNGFSDGSGNSFDNCLEEDCHPCIIADVEYLAWYMRRLHTPPLVTTGSPNATVPGALGNSDTRVVFGGELSPGEFDGGRARIEYLFPNPIDCCTGCYCFGHSQYLSVEGSVFGLEDRQRTLDVASNGAGVPVLSRPFFNQPAGREDADPIALPGVERGSAEVAFSNRLYGGEANVRVTQYGGGDCGSRLGVLAGARYLALDQALRIDSVTHDIGSGPPTGSSFIEDDFGTHNKFYGGQLGLDVEFYFFDCVDLRLLGKVAVGTSQEVLRVGGTTILTGTPSGFNTDRGLFAEPTNVGRYSKQQFAVVPEGTVTLGLRVAHGVRLYAGYNYLYWSEIYSPGNQIDRRVSLPAVSSNGGTTPQLGPAVPTVNLTTSSFWVQGAVVGVELSY